MNQVQDTPNLDADFWNKLARKYATDPIGDMAGYERTLERVSALIGSEQRVLELGCGTGTTALRLAECAESYHATDIASEMIAIAEEKLADSDCTNLTFSAEAAEAGASAESRFDVVLAFNLLHLVPDVDDVLRRVYDLTLPGGLFISKTPCLRELNPFIRWGIPVARLLGKAPKNVLSFDEEGLLEAVSSAGFAVEHVERHGSKGKDVRPFVVARRPA